MSSDAWGWLPDFAATHTENLAMNRATLREMERALAAAREAVAVGEAEEKAIRQARRLVAGHADAADVLRVELANLRRLASTLTDQELKAETLETLTLFERCSEGGA